MDGDDLDDDLALFESQIQQVKAATESVPQPSSPKTQSSNAPAKPSQQAPPSSSSPNAQRKETPKSSQPTEVHHTPSKTSSANAEPATQSAGRWVWDGASWRWRTGAASAAVKASPSSSGATPAAVEGAQKPVVTKRTAAGKVWHDPALGEFPADDHRIFVGDLAPDATEKQLCDAFGVYASFAMARIVRDKKSGACRGYGFVSFLDGRDMVRALKELNGSYVGGRPVKLRRSSWEKRALKGEKWKELKAFQRIAKR